MGYGGKVREQQRARELRAEAWTLQDIATELGVSQVVGVACGSATSSSRRTRAGEPRAPRPSSLHLRKLGRDRALRRGGRRATIGTLSRAGVPRPRCSRCTPARAARRDGDVELRQQRSTDDPGCSSRGCDASSTSTSRASGCGSTSTTASISTPPIGFWSELTGDPVEPVHASRTAPSPIRRSDGTKHVIGCPAVAYRSTATHRRVMGLIAAVLSPAALPG